MSREIAVLIAAFIGGFLAQSHRIWDLFIGYPREKARIRALVLGDVKAMVELTDSFRLEELLPELAAEGSIPVLVDPTLPRDTTHEILNQNTGMFSPEEISALTRFFRHVRASRAAILALSKEENTTAAKTTLVEAALENWKTAKSQAQKAGAI